MKEIFNKCNFDVEANNPENGAHYHGLCKKELLDKAQGHVESALKSWNKCDKQEAIPPTMENTRQCKIFFRRTMLAIRATCSITNELIKRETLKRATELSTVDPGIATVPESQKAIAQGISVDSEQEQQVLDNLKFPTCNLDSMAGVDHITKGMKKRLALKEELKHFPGALRVSKAQNTLLLFGPPGVGKSFLAECIAGHLQVPMIMILSDALFNKYVGESSKALSAFFKVAIKVSETFGGCVLLIDEIDKLFQKSDSSVTSNVTQNLYNQLIILQSHRTVQVICTTNYPEKLDAPLLRRFSNRKLIDLPDLSARVEIFKKQFQHQLLHLHNVSLGLTDNQLIHIAKSTEGYSNDSIRKVVELSLEITEDIYYYRATCFHRTKSNNILPAMCKGVCQFKGISYAKRTEIPSYTYMKSIIALKAVEEAVSRTPRDKAFKINKDFL
jgi:ATP-dependent 26S proteasome regulatory subunit